MPCLKIMNGQPSNDKHLNAGRTGFATVNRLGQERCLYRAGTALMPTLAPWMGKTASTLAFHHRLAS